MRWLGKQSPPPRELTAGAPPPGEGTVPPGTEPTWRPDPAQVAEIAKMRRRELVAISKRLGRLDNRPRGRRWEVVATLLAGGVIAGGVGLLPFLEQAKNPSTVDRLIYFGTLGLMAIGAYVCWRASRDMGDERTDTVRAIKDDLDQLLEGSLDQ